MTGERPRQRDRGTRTGRSTGGEWSVRFGGNAVSAVGLLAIVVLALAAAPPAAPAEAAANNSSAYVIEQDDQCVDVDPITNTSQSVVDFYDYRNPDTTPNATTYSSHGTTEYQADNTSILVLYRGSEGTSLVIVHEALHEPASEGTNGSSATFNVTGLSPEDDGWVVEDDDYEAQDDRFEHHTTYSEIDWVWGQGRTDGGAYRGLDGDVEIGIDPAFNESADLRYGGHYGGYVHDWQVITATDGGFERVSLDSLTRDVTVRDGYCAAPPNASLTVGNTTPEVGQTSVSLDASDSNSSTGIAEYRWDLSGNGSADRTTTDATIEHVFAAPGERNVTVTVVAGDGQTDAAAVPVNVTDRTAPTPQIDAPLTTVVDEPLAISGANSSDNHRIGSYAWTLGDGTNASGATVNHSYASPGDYNISLTVTDPSGNEATANRTVTVSQAPPNASLDAPGQATVNETVTLDAGDTEAGPNATYEWRIDGATANVTDAASYETAFTEPGAHDVSVVVTDDGGSDSASATIDVYRPLNASVAASPTNATVGEPVAFDASASTGNVTRYEWAFGDGTTIADGNATAEHEYATAAEYTAEVTVLGATGATDTATVSVDVTPAPGPTAQLSVPGEATVNETVTLDASGSTAGPNATYEWTVDGETVNTTTEPTYETVFAAAGDHEVHVLVADADGTDTANATVTVVNDSDDGSDDGSGSGGGGSSGGSGGGGGYGMPTEEPDEPVETSVAVEGETIVVTAEHANAGESFTVAVPGTATGGAASGPDASGVQGVDANASPISLRSVEITPAADAETLTVAFTPVAREVPGRFSRRAAFVPDASGPIESIGYEVAVDRQVLSAAGVSADDLTVYGHDDGWSSIETTAAVDGGHILASATVEAGVSLGVGALGPVAYVEDVRTAGVETNGTVTLATTVRNTGSERGEVTLPFVLGGEVVTTETVTLAPGEETVLRTTVPAGRASDGAVRAGGLRRQLAVVTITDLTVTPSEPGPNETATVEATLVNRGSGAGEVEAALRFDGEVAATEIVSLAPGERATVTFEQRTPAPGSYELAVGNASATMRVSEAANGTDGEPQQPESANLPDSDPEQTGNAMPGFGALAGLLALVASLTVGVLVRRRR